MANSPALVMLGTGDFAVPTFERLLDEGFDVRALVTQPARPQGRKQELIPSRIKQVALERGARVEQPERINAPEGLELLRRLGPELLVTAAYGQILSAEVLSLPRLGGINLHGSVLPKYRGAAPVARAIQAGETETGVTVILMSPQVDAGGMIAVERTPIDPDETAGELEARLAALGAPLVADCVRRLAAGSAEILPQDPSQATKAPKLRKEDGVIDWRQPARRIHDHVRAMRPWPIASTHWHSSNSSKPPTRLIVHRAAVAAEADHAGAPGHVLEAHNDRLIVAAGLGSVQLLTIQIPGKKPVDAAAFQRGHRVQPGDRLGPLEA